MKTQNGFSLIELAIVLVIVTILIGGLAVPLSAQIEARRIGETRKTMEEARESIIGYAMTHRIALSGNRYLPCPDITGDGVEDRTGNLCADIVGTVSAGFLPWVDLGVAAQDAWGNRLRYAVVATLADQGTGFNNASTVPNDPLVICTRYDCSASTPDVANNLGLVLISHGATGWGAQNINNPPLTLRAPPSGPDEVANINTDRKYVSRSPTSSEVTLGEFDDLLLWTSFTQLVARVCPTGCP